MNSNKGFGLVGLLVGVLVVALLGGGAFYGYKGGLFGGGTASSTITGPIDAANKAKDLLEKKNEEAVLTPEIRQAKELLEKEREKARNPVVNVNIDQETKDWKTYTDKEFGFEFKYPPTFGGLPAQAIATTSPYQRRSIVVFNSRLKVDPPINFIEEKRDSFFIGSMGIDVYNLDEPQFNLAFSVMSGFGQFLSMHYMGDVKPLFMYEPQDKSWYEVESDKMLGNYKKIKKVSWTEVDNAFQERSLRSTYPEDARSLKDDSYFLNEIKDLKEFPLLLTKDKLTAYPYYLDIPEASGRAYNLFLFGKGKPIYLRFETMHASFEWTPKQVLPTAKKTASELDAQLKKIVQSFRVL